MRDAPKKDGGFSPLTPGWALQGAEIAEAAHAAGLAERAEALLRFRDQLLQRIAGGPPG